MSIFNIYEEKIIRVLGRTSTGLTIREVATDSDICWMTARKHLKRLKDKGVLRSENINKERHSWHHWFLNFPF
jgi:predicted ArsR family transcriptional regulator